MTSPKVGYEVREGVAIVTIERPEVKNAMDLDTFAGLLEAGRRAQADESARAVVVRGRGDAFSSGLDMSIFASLGEGATPASIDIAALQRAFTVFERMSKPTVAAVAGPALGAGMQLAIACDLRVASTDASFGLLEVRWGIVPDLGGTQRLPRLVGLGRAKEAAMTGRRIGADEALAWGMVNRVVSPETLEKEALAWAGELAAGPPLAIAAAKRLTAAAFDSPVEAGMVREANSQRRILASQDFVEAVTARLQRRDPVYRAR